MGIIIRQGFKATIVSYIGACLGAIIVVFLYPYCLTSEQIGLTRVLLEAGLFFSFFAQLGMSNVAIRFFPYFKNENNKHNGFFFLITFIPLIGFLLFTGAFFVFKNGIISLFAENSKLFTNYIVFTIPLTFFWMYITIYESYASILQRIVIPKIIKEILVRVLTVVVIVLFFLRLINLDTFVLLFVCIYGLAMLINFFYINQLSAISFKPQFKFFNKPILKDMGLFMLYMIVAGSGSSIASKIDIYMISTKISLSDTGIFTIAFFISGFIEMPSRSIFQISAPIAAEALKKQDMSMVESLYKKVSINQLLIGGFLFVLIWANVDNIFHIMPHGAIYSKGKYVVFLIGLSKVFDAVTGINAAILSYSKYYYYTLYFIFFLAGLAILNNILFIPLYGITGAALATAVSLFLYNTLLVWFVWLKMKIHPFNRQTIKATFILAALLGINLFIYKFSNPYIDGIVRSVGISILFLVTVMGLKISEDLNNTIFLVFAKIRKSLNLG
jgi:O-antigen/teichoic acid export membrane protein